MKRFVLRLDDIRISPEQKAQVTIQADLSGHARILVKPYGRKTAHVATLADVAAWVVESKKGTAE